MVRHAKSALGSQPRHQTDSIPEVSKTKMHLPMAGGIQVSRSRKEHLPRWHITATRKLWEIFTAVSRTCLQKSANATCPALMAPQSLKCSLEISGDDE